MRVDPFSFPHIKHGYGYIKWPRCHHMNLVWSSYVIETWNDRRGNVCADYEVSQCTQCGRPLLRAGADFPASHMADVRRHTAWMFLGKFMEHASNTLVVPRG